MLRHCLRSPRPISRSEVNISTRQSCSSAGDTHIRVTTAYAIVDSSRPGRLVLDERAWSLRVRYFGYEIAIRRIRWIVLGEKTRHCLLLIGRNRVDIREPASGTVVHVIRVADWIEDRTFGLENTSTRVDFGRSNVRYPGTCIREFRIEDGLFGA
jgi:hypothetical protein